MEEYLYATLSAAISCPVKWGYFSDGEAMPRVTLVRMSGRREHTLKTKGLMRAKVQVDCWGASYSEALIASREVLAVMEGHSGGPVISSHLTATRDGNSGDAAAAHRVSLTFSLTYRN